MCQKRRHARSLHCTYAIVSLRYISSLVLAWSARPSFFGICRGLERAHFMWAISEIDRLSDADISLYPYACACAGARKSEEFCSRRRGAHVPFRFQGKAVSARCRWRIRCLSRAVLRSTRLRSAVPRIGEGRERSLRGFCCRSTLLDWLGEEGVDHDREAHRGIYPPQSGNSWRESGATSREVSCGERRIASRGVSLDGDEPGSALWGIWYSGARAEPANHSE